MDTFSRMGQPFRFPQCRGIVLGHAPLSSHAVWLFLVQPFRFWQYVCISLGHAFLSSEARWTLVGQPFRFPQLLTHFFGARSSELQCHVDTRRSTFQVPAMIGALLWGTLIWAPLQCGHLGVNLSGSRNYWGIVLGHAPLSSHAIWILLVLWVNLSGSRID